MRADIVNGGFNKGTHIQIEKRTIFSVNGAGGKTGYSYAKDGY